MARGKRRRPSVEDLGKKAEHSRENVGKTGKYGSIFKEEPPLWDCTTDSHELAVVPYFVDCEVNGPLRFAGSSLNDPFTEEQLKDGVTWDYKLSVLVHYGIGVNEDAVLCLRSINKRCPICEERDRLIKDEGMDSQDDEVRELSARKRVLYNVICFDTEKEIDKGIQVWDAPHASTEDIFIKLASKRDRRSGEIVNKPFYAIEQGWNILFEREGKGLNTEYTDHEILERRKEDEFTDEQIEDLEDNAYNLEDLVDIREYAEIYEMLHGVPPDEAPSGDEPSGRERKPRGRGRDRGDRESRRGRGREDRDASKDKDDDAKRDRGRGRGRGDRDSRRGGDKEEKGDRGRGRGRGDRKPKNEKSDDDKPKCFGLECNLRDECEKCPDDIFDDCYALYKEKQNDE